MTQLERAALIFCMVPTFPMMHDLSHLEPEVGNPCVSACCSVTDDYKCFM